VKKGTTGSFDREGAWKTRHTKPGGEMWFEPRLRLAVCRLFVPLMVVAAILVPTESHGQKAVIVVRHAEKTDDGSDPELSQAGRQRAVLLAGLLKETGVTALYGTQYKRTVQTLEPLAMALGLKIETVAADESLAQVELLRGRHAGEVVVIAGHSNSVPRLLKLLGHPDDISIEDDDYGNLFIVVPGSAVLRLRY
jgi:phosphohistidine phosphatase SixA